MRSRISTEMKERYEMIKHDAILEEKEFDEKVAKIRELLPKHSKISRNTTTTGRILNENGLLTIQMEFPVVRDENFYELQIIVVPDLANRIIIDVDKSFICVNH
jgi:hypothetical protein